MSARARQLSAYLATYAGRPFDWAAANCCRFAAGWVQAATGADPMQGLPATPGVRAAARLVQQLGGDLVQAWTRQLGTEPIAPAMAQLGDVVLLPLGEVPGEESASGGSTMGICAGMLAVLPTRDGAMAYLPMSAATAAWRLPEGAAC